MNNKAQTSQMSLCCDDDSLIKRNNLILIDNLNTCTSWLNYRKWFLW